MPADRNTLTPDQEIFVKVFAEAITEDVLSEQDAARMAAGHTSESDEKEQAPRLENRSVALDSCRA